MSAPAPIVYVVDDDPSVRKALTRLMKSVGWRVRTFASGEEFLSARAMRLPGCLVLDVHMPGINGLEVQAQLNASRVDLPIIFITAFDDPEVERRALRAGAKAFLRKPFDGQLLLDVVDHAAGRTERHSSSPGSRNPSAIARGGSDV